MKKGKRFFIVMKNLKKQSKALCKRSARTQNPDEDGRKRPLAMATMGARRWANEIDGSRKRRKKRKTSGQHF